MELIPMDVCLLCDQNTAVLTSHCSTPYIKYLNTTFLEKSKIALDHEAATDKGFCALCAHKIVVSHKFKDIYEEICKKHVSLKKTRAACFLCESKSGDLIPTDNNPNDFDTKIKCFMNSTLYPRPYLQCAVCLDCLFYLNVWFEMNLHVIEKMNSLEQIIKSPKEQSKSTNITRKEMKTRVNRTPNTRNATLRSDKENTTPPDSNNHTLQRRSQSESESLIETPKSRKRTFTAVISETEQELGINCSVNDSAINESNRNTRSKRARKRDGNVRPTKKLQLFSKQALKHLKSVKESANSAEWPENIVKDKKMFDSIPYILIVEGINQIMSEEIENYGCEFTPKKHLKVNFKSVKKPEEAVRKSSRLNKAIEVIELSDTESEINEGNESTENPSCSSSSIKQFRSKTSTPKTPNIKMRMSSSFLFASNSPSNYTCHVCDQVFKANCDYKAHCLWHDKPDDVVINITRHHLPKQIKASRFNEQQSPQKGKKQPNADVEIDTILQKYISFPSSDTLQDAEVRNSEEIDNITENINSEEKEQPEENNEQEKNIEINITENLNSEEKEQSKENNEQEKNIEINITEHLNSGEKEQSKENNEQEKNIEVNINKNLNSEKKEQSKENNEQENNIEINIIENLNSEQSKENNEQEKNIEVNINKNLNSEEKEQSEDNNEQENDIETNLEAQSKHEDSETENNVVEHSENEIVSTNTSENDNSKINAGKDTDKSQQSQIESEVEDLDNVSKENEDSESEVDTVGNSISENTNQTKTTKGHDDTTAEDDDVQSEQQESHCHDNDADSVIKEIEDIEKQQPTDNEQNSTESDLENTEDDGEVLLEKQLAKIHGEELVENDNNESDDDSNEKEQVKNHEEERPEADTQLNKNNNGLKNDNSKSAIDGVTTKNCCNTEDISESSGETDQANDEKEENSREMDSLKKDSEIGNTNICRKRKRVENLVMVDETPEESSDDVEIVTHKAKKVRFAMDYQDPNPVKEDHTPHVISDEEDVHIINSTEDAVQEIEDDDE